MDGLPVPRTKFTFDTEFFEVVGTGRNAAPVQLPTTRTNEAKVQQAFTEGHAAGLQEGQQQAQADLARLQQHLQNTLHALQQSKAEAEQQMLKDMLGLVQATLHTLLGHASFHYGPEVLEHHLRSLLPLARTEEQLTLRLHPGARGYHEKLGLAQATIMGLPLRIVPDPNLGPVDAVIEWSHGGVEARLADHTNAVNTLLAAAGASPIPATDFLSPLGLGPTTATVAPTMPSSAPAPSPATPSAKAVVADDLLDQAARERTARAAALLGDDDLVDALK